jgi:hypothetical protein
MNAVQGLGTWSPARVRGWLKSGANESVGIDSNSWLGVVEVLSLRVETSEDTPVEARLDWLWTIFAVLDAAVAVGAMTQARLINWKLGLYSSAAARIPSDQRPDSFDLDGAASLFLAGLPCTLEQAADLSARWHRGQQQAMWREQREELYRLRDIKGWLMPLDMVKDEVRSPELRTAIKPWLALGPSLP